MLTIPRRASIVNPCSNLCFNFIFVSVSCLSFVSLWSPAGKGLTSWLFYMLGFFVVTFLIGVLGQVVKNVCINS